MVCTSGASGPIAPPDAMHSHEIGINERNVRMPVAEPDTWMLSTMSSTSPGLPTQRVTSAANRPAPPSTRKPIAPLHSVGHRTCWRRWITRRYPAPTIPAANPTSTTRPTTRADTWRNTSFAHPVIRDPSTAKYRSTIYFRMATRRVTDADYRRLLAFRTELRRFLHWSEERARDAGLTPAQHQLLLAIRGHDGPAGPTVGEVAAALLLRHHSAVGLVDRAADAGLVRRHSDPDDQRVVHLRLTARGERVLEELSEQHVAELARLRNGLL